MDKGAMLELASRVKAASAPDRELDAQVGRYFAADFLGYVPDEPATGCVKFTASLDAAMSLVPEGWQWRVGTEGYVAGAYAVLTNIQTREESRCDHAATPALALTAACLRALASQVPHGE